MKNFLKCQIYVVTYENIHVHTKYTLKLTKGHGMRPASKQTRKKPVFVRMHVGMCPWVGAPTRMDRADENKNWQNVKYG